MDSEQNDTMTLFLLFGEVVFMFKDSRSAFGDNAHLQIFRVENDFGTDMKNNTVISILHAFFYRVFQHIGL